MSAPVASLGFRTDLALLLARGSTVKERDGYRVVRTEENPGFRWGNFLLLDRAPQADVQVWCDVVAQELPGRSYTAIGVDQRDAIVDVASWTAAGFAVERMVVLTAERAPAGPDPVLPVRVLEGDDDWAALVDLETTEFPGEPEYTRLRVAAHRRAAEAGTGAWWGAFDGALLVAGLGLYETGDGDARYQAVATLESYRRRGLAGALVRMAGESALATGRVRRLVILADPDGPAIGLYRRAGFVDVETMLQLERIAED